MSDRQLYAYVDLDREPMLVGRLWARVRKGRESATFEYDDTWLKHPQRFALEPALVLGRGPQHTEDHQAAHRQQEQHRCGVAHSGAHGGGEGALQQNLVG